MQLTAIGIGRRAIGHRLERGRLHRVHQGVYAVGHRALSPEGRWMAAVLAAGPGLFSATGPPLPCGEFGPARGPASRSRPPGACVDGRASKRIRCSSPPTRGWSCTAFPSRQSRERSLISPQSPPVGRHNARCTRPSSSASPTRSPSMTSWTATAGSEAQPRSGASSKKAGSARESPGANSKTASSPSSMPWLAPAGGQRSRRGHRGRLPVARAARRRRARRPRQSRHAGHVRKRPRP